MTTKVAWPHPGEILLHEFLERVSEFAPESMDDAQGVLGNIDQLKLGTRWGWDGDSI